MRYSQETLLGIALSGGAARGLSHIGVLKVLEKAGILPSAISGSSIGSLVAASYVCGTLHELEETVISLRKRDLIEYADIYFKGGVLKGESIREGIRRFTKDMTFEDVSQRGISLVIVGADLATGEPVFLRQGSIADAVRASISVPGLFAPVKVNGRVLVDGGLVDLMPVDALANTGATVLLGVDVFSRSDLWTRAATGARVSVGFVRHVWKEVLGFAESEVINRIAYAENLARAVFVEKFGSRIQNTFNRIYGALISDNGDQCTPEDGEMTLARALSTGETTKPGSAGQKTSDEETEPEESREPEGWSTVKAILAAFDITESLLQSPRDGIKPDLVIRPRVQGFHGHQFYRAREIIREGEIAAQEVLPELMAMMQRPQAGSRR
ncbi:MAG: patatin-like phospholipase family protein [Candidatus Fermentithermobacillus carboniphilus]|uniref:Patatin-like phospholipase family protein n=1 Tax=Candidatus Fermentithermobacillus carboniphilus TaxID=3085328 RepID=A0AAT9LCH2_9FIRM|nr:MAG: patatin-like phospholipase family protein [Candidatus Fermentithermobacillus carboniphilus]